MILIQLRRRKLRDHWGSANVLFYHSISVSASVSSEHTLSENARPVPVRQ